MLAPVHLRYTRASTVSSLSASSSLSSFLSSDANCALLNASVAGPGAQASLRRLLKGLQDELASQPQSTIKESESPAKAASAGERDADKAARKAAKVEKKRKSKDSTEGETKRRKV